MTKFIKFILSVMSQKGDGVLSKVVVRCYMGREGRLES